MELGEKDFWNTMMLGNGGGTKSFDFQSDQNAMNVNYIGEVTLTGGFSNDIVHRLRTMVTRFGKLMIKTAKNDRPKAEP